MKKKSVRSLGRTLLGVTVAMMACTDLTGPGNNSGIANLGNYSAKLVLGTRIVYLGAAKSEPINFIRVLVYDQKSGKQVGSVSQTLDPAKDEFDFTFSLKLPNPGFTTTRMTIELANRVGTTEVVQYSGKRPDMKISPGDIRQVDIDLYPGPLSNFDVIGVAITEPLTERIEGDSLQAVAVVQGGTSDVRVIWSSLDSTVAQVSPRSGMITSRLPGRARVVAAVGYVADTAFIDVLRRRARVVVTPSTITLKRMGDTAAYVAQIVDPRGAPFEGETVSWTIDNAGIGEFLNGGKFRSKGPGKSAVTASAMSDPSLKGKAMLDVAFVPASLAQTTITPSPASIVANGIATSTITVRLKDENGNDLPETGSIVTLSKVGGGTLSAVTDKRDGTYTATVTAPTVTGIATISGTMDGGALARTGVVRYVPGPASLTRSIITASPTSIVATGSNTTTITVRLRDEFGNDLTSSAGTVALSTTLGNLSGVIDNGDGSYTGILTSGTVVGLAVVSATLNGSPLVETVSVTFRAGLASTSGSTVTAVPVAIIANGTSTSAITIRLKDVHGNNTTAGGLAISASIAGTGTISALTDNGDGTYSAVVTAPTALGSGIVAGFIGGSAIVNTATVSYIAGPPVGYIITISTTTSVVGSTVTVTAQMVDAFGNHVSLAGRTITWGSTSGGSFSPATSVTDANGTATASFTTSTVAGTSHDITVTDDGSPVVSATAGPIVTTPAPVSLSASTISAAPASIVANGVSTSTISVQLKDVHGNNTTAEAGSTVSLSRTGTGTLSSVTSNGNGSYSATVTAPTVIGSAIISADVGGAALTSTAAVSFVVGPASLSQSTIVALPNSIPANGTSQSAITVVLKDATGNLLVQSGGTVTLRNSGIGSLTGVTDHNNGTYTAVLTAPEQSGVITISASLNGSLLTHPSNAAFVTFVAQTPGQVTGLSATAGNQQVTLSWTPPVSTGGAPITDYLIEYRVAGTNTWVSFPHTVSASTSIAVTGLSNGTPYEFRVSAINSAGTGPASTPASATPISAPGAPTNLAGTPGNQLVALTWAAPANNGGAAVTDYLVEYKLSSSGTWLTFNDGVSATAATTVTGLTNGSSYDFRVSATNSTGTGSPGSIATATPRTVPDAPTSVSAIPGNQQMTLVWIPPANNGGSAITDYVIEYKPSTSSTWLTFSDGVSSTAAATVTGLNNGTSYDFRVSATNVAGTSTPSSTATGTPRTMPGASTGLTATPGNQLASLTWNAPSNDGGSPIIDYLVEYKLSSSATWLTFNDGVSTTTATTVTGLTNGSEYDFRVTPINGVQTGTSSVPATALLATVPDAPTNLAATAGNQEMSLSWSAPANDGGSAITDYLVEYKLASSITWLVFNDGTSTSTNATVTGLANGSAYDFRVSATNVVGTGSPSGAATGTPRTMAGTSTSLAGTPGNQQVALTWTAPSNDGGSAITDYVVEYKLSSSATWLTFNDGVSTTASATVTGLTNGSAYDFRVSATNSNGTGSPSSTATATPRTVPGAPTSLAATSGDQQMSLTWTAPASNGGSAITDYLVEYKLTSGSTWLTFSDGTSTTAAATVTGLTNGSSYDFRVSATNVAGTGAPTSPGTATPGSFAGAPTGLAGTPGNQQVVLAWTAPSSNGGSAITDYLVEYKLTSSSTWLTFNDGVSTTAAATVTGLTNGSAYDFRVSATNSNGTGSPSSTATATPRTVPGAPTSLAATSGDQQMSLTWTAPTNNGGSAITDYLVEYKLTSSSTWLTFSDGTSTTAAATVTGLTNGSSYDFRVSATNVAGTGPASSTATATPITLAGAPTSLAGTPGNQQVALSWTAPSSNGGSAITDYLVEYKLTSSSTWLTFNDGVSTTASATVTGLTNGSAYDFRVSATNSNGTGSPSSTATATPRTVPDAPTSLATTAGDQQTSLTWTAPSNNGGSAITDYLVEYKLTSSSTWLTFSDGVSTTAAATVTGLTNGSAYNFRVSATNVAGTGVPSSTATATPITLAGAPTSLAGTPGNQQVALTWTAPTSNGGSAITDYLVEYKLSSSSTWSTFSDGVSTTAAATVTGLTNGSAYDFRVSATNSNGTGVPSATATATPRTVPDAPTNLAASPGSLQMGLTWTAPSNNGGSAITDYLVEYKLTSSSTWLTFNDGTSTTAAATVTGLVNGSSYDFRVSATNVAGTGAPTSPGTATPGAFAGAPTNLAGTPGDTQVALTWTAPTSNGGSAITDYLVEYKLSSGSTWSTFTDGVSTTAAATVTGLTNGSSYDFRVSAINSNGTGPASATASATPRAVPGAPTSLAATAGNQQVGLTWSAPSSNGGSAITDYLVEFKLSSGSTWSTFSDGVSTTAATTVTGLTNGSAYDFRVSAINGAGTGSASSTATATPRTVPGAPTSLATSVGNQQMSLTWSAPSSNGGSAITDYLVEYKLSSSSTWLTFSDGVSTTTGATVTGLTNGSAYDFRVSATNIAGTGPTSSTATGTPITLAGAPTSLAGTPGNQQVALTWTAPSNDGGSAITDYLVEYKLSSSGTWLTFNDGVSTTTGATVTGLTNGSAYDFRVSTINSNGTGNPSSTATATPRTVPDAPTSLAATVGDQQMSLTWTAPSNNGGSAITDYLVEYKLTSSGTWLTFSDGVSTTAAATVIGLTNGSAYDFRVSATNVVGTGAPGSSASATPRTTAGAPTSLAATPGNQQVVLAWTAPSNNGGSAITDYLVEYKLSSSGTWLTFNDGVAATTGATVTSLTNGSAYDFRVSAINGAGTGSASSTATATPRTVPGAPTSLATTPGDQQMALTWTAPASNGGSAITDYLVEYKLTSSGTWLTFNDGVSTTAAATVTGLTNANSYDFRVSATNIAGTGVPGSTATATPVSVPGAPTSLAATGGNAQAVLTWTAPVSDGGSAITDYLVEYKLTSSGTWLTFSDGVTATTGATVTSLTNGSSYDFRVSATTGNGTGSPSSTATATPRTVPGAPTSLSPTAGNQQVALTWTAPASNGGSAITDYLVEYKLNSSGTWLTFSDGVSTTAATTVTGLVNGSLYDFRVSATNAAGTGAASSTASSTPRTVPDAPTSLAGTPAATSVALTWTAPANNGGSAITDYLVEYKLSSSGTWLTFSDGVTATTGATVNGLTNNTSYDFRVSTTNVAGTGVPSSQITSVPGAPTAPISLGVTLNQIDASNHTASLSWTVPSSTGGSAITDYIVEYQISGAGSYTVFSDGVSTGTTTSITGLANGTTYNFRVAAQNSVGTGPYSNVVTATTTAPSERLACSTPGASNSSANSASIVGCSGVIAGNYIVIPISVQNASTTVPLAITAPSGFINLGTEMNGDFQTTVFYKVAVGGVDNLTPTYDFSWSGNIKNVITLVAYKTVSGTPVYLAAHGTSSPMTSPTGSDPGQAHTLVYIFSPKASMGSTSPTLGQWTISNDLFKNTTAGANNAQAIAVLTADVDRASGAVTARTGTTSGLSVGNPWNVTVLVIHP